jgi:hypothetical protein
MALLKRVAHICGYLLLLAGVVGLPLGVARVVFGPPTDPYTEVLWFVPKPDVDGRLRFRGPTYQFRVSPERFVSASIWSNQDIPFYVGLSIDRREFGAPQPAVRQEPRLVCGESGPCRYVCLEHDNCESLRNGWYRVHVLPAEWEFGPDPRALNEGPVDGAGILCGDAGKAGLEFCWDPFLKTPSIPLKDIAEASYPAAMRSREGVWVSISRDASGRPDFVARCNIDTCTRSIEWKGARFDIDFSSSELDDWKRFNAGLYDFAARLIETLPDTSKSIRR